VLLNEPWRIGVKRSYFTWPTSKIYYLIRLTPLKTKPIKAWNILSAPTNIPAVLYRCLFWEVFSRLRNKLLIKYSYPNKISNTKWTCNTDIEAVCDLFLWVTYSTAPFETKIFIKWTPALTKPITCLHLKESYRHGTYC